MKDTITITKELCKNNYKVGKDEILDLINNINQADDDYIKNLYIEQLITLHSKLIMKYARKYEKYCQSLTLDDLFQAGVIGLLNALNKFDTSLGYTFSTYCTWWINQSITREIADTDKTIRLPVYLEEKMHKLAATQEYILKNNLQYTNELMLDIVKSKFEKENMTFDMQDVKTFNELSSVMSIDYKLEGEEKNSSYENKFYNNILVSPDDIYDSVYKELLSNDIKKIMRKILTEKEYDIISLRFGFRDGICYTLQEVATKYAISRERVRQLEGIALRKMRNIFPCYGINKNVINF